jgi:O-antigen/teichoic acid export membrane protein
MAVPPELELKDPERPEFLSRVVSGFSWALASQGLSQILTTGVLVLLTRLLAPKEFGIAAMAMVLSTFVITYSDCGLGLALVQKESISEADRNTVFWASIALGAVMTTLCIAVAPLIARFYHTPEVEHLVDVLAFSFFVTGIGSTHRSLHFRAMNFRALEIRSMAAAVAGAIVTIGIALDGGGPWAIIIGNVTAAATSTVLLLAMGAWVPRLMFRWQSLRDLGGYGLRYVGGMTFLTLNGNADNILVGRVLGQAALGTYTLAYSMILVPLSRIAAPVCQLITPALARLQNDKQALAGNWLRGTRLLLMIFLPVMLTVAVTAPDVVRVLFGTKWDGAIPVVRILAPVGALLSIQALADSVLQATGAMRTYMRMRGLSFCVNIAAFFVGVRWGLTGMAAAVLISTLAFLVLYVGVVARVAETSAWRFGVSLLGVLVAAAALIISEAVVYGMLADNGGPILRIGVTGAIGVATFGLVCFWREREALLELLRISVTAIPIPRRLIPAALQSA